MGLIKVALILFVSLYIAAFAGGFIQGKIGPKARSLRVPISILSYFVIIALAFVFLG